MIFFFNNLMHKLFILIHLLYSSACFEHYCVIFRRIIVLVQHLVSSPKETDVTRCCTNTIVLLKTSKIVLETCRGM